jgi:transcriptional regulator with PAS, ATPase and Fis domain
LQGESGTGKELLARYIHRSSARGGGPFVAVNCAGLPESLLESELFGHEKGAFTGAMAKKPGKFDLANGGTLLLDEISEMDPALQAKLLRALQEGEIDPVGGKGPHKVDVRVIATTNRKLKDWVEAGRFRSDLFYRLNVMPFYIPALRERREDIESLAAFFAEKHGALNHKGAKGISEAAMELLRAHDWPGNVRELENTVARAVLMAQGEAIEAHDVFMDEAGFMAALERNADRLIRPPEPAPEVRQPAGPSPADLSSGASGNVANSHELPAGLAAASSEELPLMTIMEMERCLIGKALQETSGNRTHAAKLLGISVRTLRNKLAEYRGEGAAPPGAMGLGESLTQAAVGAN